MNKFEYAATVAASLIYLLMHQQDACGLMLFDHGVRDQVPPASSTAQLLGMIKLIERTQPAEQTEVKALFSELADRLRQRGLVIVISDLLTDVEQVIDGLQRLRYTQHDVIVLHVMDRDELEFPFQDNMLFEGLEEQDQQILADPQALRRSYLEIVGRFVSRLRSACADHRIDYKLMSTRDPLDGALAALLAARMRQT